MHRTQIYLTDDLHRALARLSKQTGVTRSQLIRTALERAYLPGAGSATQLREPRASYSGSADDVPTWAVTAASAGGGAFDFWDSEDEDLYLPTDGAPIE